MRPGLASRPALPAELDRSPSRAQRTRRTVGVLLADLDGSKSINASFGHAIGDQVLREFAGKPRQAVRRHDVAGRLGGDELADSLTHRADMAMYEIKRIAHSQRDGATA